MLPEEVIAEPPLEAPAVEAAEQSPGARATITVTQLSMTSVRSPESNAGL
jgi:hypothetical protein